MQEELKKIAVASDLHSQHHVGVLSMEEQKGDLIRSPASIFNSLYSKTSLIRGKGRPKGEKNSKGNSKREKSVVHPENRRKGHWSLQENKRYHWFLQIHNHHFIHKEMRRLDKIFKTMAAFIGTRQAEQCRSHHQKMEKKYKSFQKILIHLRQSHYGSCDSTAVEEDMMVKEIDNIFNLINAEQLINYQKLDESSSLQADEENEDEAKLNEGNLQKQFITFGSFHDILGDNYELQLDFNNLHLQNDEFHK